MLDDLEFHKIYHNGNKNDQKWYFRFLGIATRWMNRTGKNK